MSMTIGPYEFTISDARKTLFHAMDLVDLCPPSRAGFGQERRARVSQHLIGDDVLRADEAGVEQALFAVWPEVLAARDDLVASGALPASQVGRVERLSVSNGGVPKHAVDRVEVGFDGAAGDRQAAREHHGRPWQALCVWSSEVIAALAADGHPIEPGAAGENVTVSGLQWRDVRPGTRLRIGTVLCQVSAFAVPCSKNARWFSDGDSSRIHYSRGPISRVYATVLEPGAIATGDDAVLEPA